MGGKYLLTAVLGAGGMGAVYEAENTWTGRPVALKILHPELTRETDVVERFMQEAQLASQLRHPNIVDVLDLGREPSDGALFIVQELLRGETLRAHLDAHGSVDPATALDIVIPVMGALAMAHRRSVVHRDLKPENIFLARDDSGELTPKLIDFGISKIVTETREDRNITQAGAIVGTPNYMSPEQARGEATLDGQTDVWSLGVVLYEMLAGRVPFDAPNQNVLMVKIITEQPPRIETFAPSLPSPIADLVHGAVCGDRALRFPDMQHFIASALHAGVGGDLFERHRRSIVSSAETSGHFQALARSTAAAIAARATPTVSGRAPRVADTPSGTWSHDATQSPVPHAPVPRRWIPVVGGSIAFGLAMLIGALAMQRRTPAARPPVEVRIPAPSVTAPPPAPQVVAPASPPVVADAAVEASSPAVAPVVVRRRPPVPPVRRPTTPTTTQSPGHNGAPILAP